MMLGSKAPYPRYNLRTTEVSVKIETFYHFSRIKTILIFTNICGRTALSRRIIKSHRSKIACFFHRMHERSTGEATILEKKMVSYCLQCTC